MSVPAGAISAPGKRDCFGLYRDSKGYAIWETTQNDSDLSPADALALAEIKSPLHYKFLPLGVPSVETLRIGGVQPPTGVFVTSLNMDYIPDLSLDTQEVFIRRNGRFFTHDFTLWPQWYFEITSVLPYILRRPSPEMLVNHEHRMAWYDPKDEDFVQEKGTPAEVGRIRPDLAQQLNAFRDRLSNKVDALIATSPVTSADQYRELQYARRSLQNTSVCLQCAPQSRLTTLLTLTAFQRWYLETLAWLDFFEKWTDRLSSVRQHPVDNSIMGAVTASIADVQNFYQIGVPVWYVRPPSMMSGSIRVVRVVEPRRSFDGLVDKIYPNTALVFRSAPSPYRNRVSQVMRMAGVEIGPASKEVHHGETPSTSTAAQTRPSVPSQRAVNTEKFSDAPSPVLSAARPQWSKALKSVNISVKGVSHPDADLLRGYPLPDAFMLMKIHDHEIIRYRQFVCIWLCIRSAWLSHITSRHRMSIDKQIDPSPMPTPYQWRQYLLRLGSSLGITFEPSTQTNGSSRKGQASTSSAQSKSPKPSKQARRNNQSIDTDIFDLPLQLTGSMGDIYWQGQMIRKAGTSWSVPLDLRICRQVQWDLVDNTWRLELLALDRCVISRSTMTSFEASDRDVMVADVFPDGQFLRRTLPVDDQGLGALDWKNRVRQVENFGKLLSAWPGNPAKSIAQLIKSTPLTEAMADRVENIAYPFYCQTFFNYFSRAPTIPRPFLLV